MKIILDIMGADNPPSEFINAAVTALDEVDCEIILVGDQKTVEENEAYKKADKSRISVVHTDEVITMEDHPTDVLRAKRNCSMATGLKMLANGEGDAMVSAGNTGALFSGATVIVKPIEGVRRAAIAAVLPLKKPVLLLDSGANVVAGAELLEQFAVMGAVYYSCMFGVENASVGLLNNGTEEHKGTAAVADAYRLLKASDLNFVGNIEGKDIPLGKCDVVVTDGFTGNIVLKYTEGMGSMVFSMLKEMLTANPAAKFSALLLKDSLHDMKKRFSSSDTGGAPFIGISKPVIKAHGNSDATAIKNAIVKASEYARLGVTELIAQKIAK